METIFFKDAAEFRKWLAKNHESTHEIFVGFYRISTGKGGITWPEAVEQALCFGWIDSVRNKIDDESYSNRFTPRKPSSNWSAVNIKKVEELVEKGLMLPAGLAAFEKRTENRSKVYAYENDPAHLPPELEQKFRKNKMAWTFFDAQAPSYKKTIIHWIMRAKQEKTIISRLDRTIIESEGQRRLV